MIPRGVGLGGGRLRVVAGLLGEEGSVGTLMKFMNETTEDSNSYSY